MSEATSARMYATWREKPFLTTYPSIPNACLVPRTWHYSIIVLIFPYIHSKMITQLPYNSLY